MNRSDGYTPYGVIETMLTGKYRNDFRRFDSRPGLAEKYLQVNFKGKICALLWDAYWGDSRVQAALDEIEARTDKEFDLDKI